jgi:hypothetical protein
MARRAANVTQADVARVIRAAKQAGAIEVEVRIGDWDVIIVRIAPSTGAQVPVEKSSEIVL